MSNPGTTQLRRMRDALRRWVARVAHWFAGVGEALLEILFFWR